MHGSILPGVDGSRHQLNPKRQLCNLHCTACSGPLSFAGHPPGMIFGTMNTINGLDAINLMKEISKVPDGTFTIAFYPYNRTKGEASDQLRTIEGCKVRAQLPQEKWSVAGDNYFLFLDKTGDHKSCYRILIRFVGFPSDGFKLRKVKWLNQ